MDTNIGRLDVGIPAGGTRVAAVDTRIAAVESSVAAVDACRSHRLRVCTTSELASDLYYI